MAGAGRPAAQRARDTCPAGSQRDHLALAGRWKLAGAAVRFLGLADSIWLVPQMAGAWAVRPSAVRRALRSHSTRNRAWNLGLLRPPAASGWRTQGGTAPGHHRHAVGQVHPCAWPAPVRCSQEGAGAQARGPGRCRRHLARRRPSTQERDTLPALDVGKTEWPSLREAIFDGAFTAERCREWSNLHGMRHRVVERDPEQKGFVVLAGRWAEQPKVPRAIARGVAAEGVERSFGWLVHWAGCSETARVASMSPPLASHSRRSCPVSRLRSPDANPCRRKLISLQQALSSLRGPTTGLRKTCE